MYLLFIIKSITKLQFIMYNIKDINCSLEVNV